MMRPTAYYNENDRAKAAWLRHLIEEGAIAPGVVDERSIKEVQPDDLAGFVQCHFFAGIGVWSHSLRLAGWPDDRPVWTGSCPCGPFSVAGVQKGFDDPRHLWPSWFPLIRERRPDVLFGEQVDDALAWLDLVASDMEGSGYAFGAPDLAAAGFGGAHIRQRLFWVADRDDAEWWSERAPWHDGRWPKTGRVQGDRHPGDGGAALWLVDAGRDGGGRHAGTVPGPQLAGQERGLEPWPVGDGIGDAGADGRLGSPNRPGLPDAQFGIVRRPGWGVEGGAAGEPSHPSGTGVDWLLCRDSKWRPVESGACPLVDEAPARMGRLRGYGDAIDAVAAAEFIAAYMAESRRWAA